MTDLYVTMTDLERQRDQARHELQCTRSAVGRELATAVTALAIAREALPTSGRYLLDKLRAAYNSRDNAVAERDALQAERDKLASELAALLSKSMFEAARVAE